MAQKPGYWRASANRNAINGQVRGDAAFMGEFFAAPRCPEPNFVPHRKPKTQKLNSFNTLIYKPKQEEQLATCTFHALKCAVTLS